MSELSRRLAWFQMDDPQPTLVAAADELRDRDETRRMAIRIWDDLYEGRSLFAATNAPALGAIGRDGFDIPRLNFARRALDHNHAKITSETPSVRALGHGADARTRVKARKLTKFINGVYDDLDLETVLPRSALGVLRNGASGVQVGHRDGRLTVEVVSAREMFVDPDDARHGDPRCLYRIRPVDRRGLMAELPDLAAEIEACGASADPLINVSEAWVLGDGRSDAIDLYDAWLLPRGDDPGRHVQCLNNVLILDEEWECPRFPIAILMEREPAPGSGFWGLGLMARLDGVQFQIDSLVSHITEAIQHANLKVFVPDTGDVVMDHLTEPAIGTVVMHGVGAQPQFVVPEPVAQQEIDWVKYLVSQLYSMAGMDESGASSTKPAGIDSGVALRYYHDFQSQTFVDLIKRYGRHACDVTARLIDEARRMAADTEDDQEFSFAVRYRRGSVVREIDWSDVDMDEDSFLLELEEVSPVPDTPAGRIQQLQEDLAAGRVSPEYYTQLVEDPDRWFAERTEGQADADFVEDLIERLQDPDAPMPRILDQMDKPLAAARLRTELLTAVRTDDDLTVVERLDRFLTDLVASMEPPPAPAAGPTGSPPAPGSAGGAPQGAPMAPGAGTPAGPGSPGNG